MKEGSFAVYKGKEYETFISPDLKDKDIAMLRTTDISELNNGFSEGFYGITKKVKIDSLDAACEITNYAMYNGYIFRISDEKWDQLYLWTDSMLAANKLEMEQIDRGSYYKWVMKSEVEKVWEEKSDLWGFTPGVEGRKKSPPPLSEKKQLKKVFKEFFKNK